MSNKIYHLSTCSTCQRIIKELEMGDAIVQQDIKTEAITADQLNEMQNGLFEKALQLRKENTRDIDNIEVIVADMNDFDINRQFDDDGPRGAIAKRMEGPAHNVADLVRRIDRFDLFGPALVLLCRAEVRAHGEAVEPVAAEKDQNES